MDEAAAAVGQRQKNPANAGLIVTTATHERTRKARCELERVLQKYESTPEAVAAMEEADRLLAMLEYYVWVSLDDHK